jgi:hypothetical protein
LGVVFFVYSFIYLFKKFLSFLGPFYIYFLSFLFSAFFIFFRFVRFLFLAKFFHVEYRDSGA